jgi:cell division protein FtsQ
LGASPKRDEVRRRRRLTALAVLAIFALLGVAYASTYTSLFGADTVEVEGASRISESRLMRMAGVQLGTNVFHLDTARAERRLERDPWIAGATVTRGLPSTIRIVVRERAPLAVAPDGRVVAVDGVVLPGAPSDGLPVLRATVGELSPQDEGYALDAVAALDPAVRADVTAVLIDPSHDVRLSMKDGVLVTFGPAGDEGQKAVALHALLRWAEQQHASLAMVDVSVPSAPAATLLDGSTVSP